VEGDLLLTNLPTLRHLSGFTALKRGTDGTVTVRETGCHRDDRGSAAARSPTGTTSRHRQHSWVHKCRKPSLLARALGEKAPASRVEQ